MDHYRSSIIITCVSDLTACMRSVVRSVVRSFVCVHMKAFAMYARADQSRDTTLNQANIRFESKTAKIYVSFAFHKHTQWEAFSRKVIMSLENNKLSIMMVSHEICVRCLERERNTTE